MAKVCMIERDKKRKRLAAKHKDKRKRLKDIIMDKNFYNECSEKAKNNFYQHSSENAFNNWKKDFFSNIDEFIGG